MGRNRHGTLPKITVHPRSGHARVRYNGKEIWLGKHGSPEAQQKYERIFTKASSHLLLMITLWTVEINRDSQNSYHSNQRQKGWLPRFEPSSGTSVNTG